jgi:hypothetical protein
MRFYFIEPCETPELGENTVLDTTTHPPTVKCLHVELDYWDDDDLISCYPAYLVSERCGKALESSGATGYTLAPAEVAKSEQFELFEPTKIIPRFLWFNVTGEAAKDDIGLLPVGRLIVSERALRALKSVSLKHCRIVEAE